MSYHSVLTDHGYSIYLQVYPGLMITSGVIHYILNSLHITIHIRDVCVFLAPTFRSNITYLLLLLCLIYYNVISSGFTAIAMFLMTREVWSTGAGLLAAACMAIG